MADPQSKSTPISAGDVQEALRKFGGSAGSFVASNPDYLARTIDLLQGVADKSASGSVAAITGAVEKGVSTTGAPKQGKQLLKATSFVLDESAATMNAFKILGAASPGKAGVAVGMLVLQKAGIATSMVAEDQKTAQCVGALMSLAANVGTTAALGIGTGVGAVLTVASTFASAAVAVQACAPSK